MDKCYMPTVNGIGCRGCIVTGQYDILFRKWRVMIYKSTKNKRPYTVYDRWLCFKQFVEDFSKIKNYELYLKEPDKYNLTNMLSDDPTIFDLEHASFETYGTIRYLCSNNLGYRGVYKLHGRKDKYNAACVVNGKKTYLGSYKTPEAAANAVDAYLTSIGDTSFLNEANPDIIPERNRFIKVLDHNNIDTNKIWYSDKGVSFRFTGRYKKCISKNGKAHEYYSYEIEFIGSGAKQYVRGSKLTKGKYIKDIMAPSVCGIGIVGMPVVPKEYMQLRDIWGRMITKISQLYPKYNHDELILNDKVDEKWLCFKDFIEDVKNVSGYDIFASGMPCKFMNMDYSKRIDSTAYVFVPIKRKKKGDK